MTGDLMVNKVYDLIIVGGGIAGITAAIYAARKEMKFAIISPEFGGEIMNTTYVENWPGIKSISGRALANDYIEHMKSLNVEIIEDAVTEVKFDGHFWVTAYGGVYESKTLIWATGSRSKDLGVPGEGELRSRGVTYCSICDGPLYKHKVVAVVGAGNVALTSSIYMANIAKKVYIINRSERIRGDPILLDKLKEMHTVEIINNAKVKSINGEKEVHSITLESGQEVQVNGVIINIGYTPVTDPVKDIVPLNQYGYIEVDWKGMSKTEGLFAAGDVVFNPYKQLVISASDGARAALGAYDYLSSKK
jgi:NADH-dependent peroxiredoxin subunit F